MHIRIESKELRMAKLSKHNKNEVIKKKTTIKKRFHHLENAPKRVFNRSS